jgi:hypothetical protein
MVADGAGGRLEAAKNVAIKEAWFGRLISCLDVSPPAVTAYRYELNHFVKYLLDTQKTNAKTRRYYRIFGILDYPDELESR